MPVLTKQHFTASFFLKKELKWNAGGQSFALLLLCWTHCSVYGCFIWGLILVFSNQVYWLDLLQSQICLSFILMMTMIGYCVFSLLFSLPFLEKIPREPPDNLQMTSNNFQHILSWRAHSDPTVPTYYRVLYSSHRQVLLHIRHNLFFLCLSVQNTQPCYFFFLSVFPLHKDAFI